MLFLMYFVWFVGSGGAGVGRKVEEWLVEHRDMACNLLYSRPDLSWRDGFHGKAVRCMLYRVEGMSGILLL